MSEKKATDFLLEMDDKLNKILSFISNVDFNLKLISSKLTVKPVDQVAEQTARQIEPATFYNVDAVEPMGQPDNRKVTVHQKVTYPNDKPAVLANVKIFNSLKEEVKSTKTNHAGKWNAVLDPGNYFIHITKAEVADKPKIDHYFEIEIQASKIPIELESKK